MNTINSLVSICIPVKDFDTRPLVMALLEEIRASHLNAEILILEDGSSVTEAAKNKPLEQESEIRLFRFPTNKGRSAARNKLADEAEGQYLLFLDADSLPLNNNFIQKYLINAQENTILCGGRHYNALYKNKQTTLHWKFGTQREHFSALGKDNTSFYSNNFFIEKSTFQKIRFDEGIVLYGHEDTLFGFTAKAIGVKIELLENAIIHTQLESNEDFLSKTEESILSLVQIINQKELHPSNLINEFKIWRTYDLLHRYKLSGLLEVLGLLRNAMRYMLLHFSGPLMILDVYKLVLLHRTMKAK